MNSILKTMLYVAGGLVFLVIIQIAGQIGKSGAEVAIDSISEKKIDKGELLNQVIIELNKKTQLPMTVDEVTTLVRVYAEGDDVLVYEYELSAESIDVIALKPIIYERIKDNIGKTAKEIGISIVYTYKSKNTGKIIGIIRFDKNEL
jgi:hypothetical protein